MASPWAYGSRNDPFVEARRVVVEKLKIVMAAVGAETRDDVKESINTPYPPSSAPYTPPHRRTGRLHDGVTHAQTVLPDRIREEIESERVPGDPRVPQILEHFGNPNMAPRPYMGPARNRVAGTLLNNVAGKFKL